MNKRWYGMRKCVIGFSFDIVKIFQHLVPTRRKISFQKGLRATGAF
jgi:hypothetical protein